MRRQIIECDACQETIASKEFCQLEVETENGAQIIDLCNSCMKELLTNLIQRVTVSKRLEVIERRGVRVRRTTNERPVGRDSKTERSATEIS